MTNHTDEVYGYSRLAILIQAHTIPFIGERAVDRRRDVYDVRTYIGHFFTISDSRKHGLGHVTVHTRCNRGMVIGAVEGRVTGSADGDHAAVSLDLILGIAPVAPGTFGSAVGVLVFLPLYLRSGITTIPEYLEKRYGATTRLLFAIYTVFNNACITLVMVLVILVSVCSPHPQPLPFWFLENFPKQVLS